MRVPNAHVHHIMIWMLELTAPNMVPRYFHWYRWMSGEDWRRVRRSDHGMFSEMYDDTVEINIEMDALNYTLEQKMQLLEEKRLEVLAENRREQLKMYYNPVPIDIRLLIDKTAGRG